MVSTANPVQHCYCMKIIIANIMQYVTLFYTLNSLLTFLPILQIKIRTNFTQTQNDMEENILFKKNKE